MILLEAECVWPESKHTAEGFDGGRETETSMRLLLSFIRCEATIIDILKMK